MGDSTMECSGCGAPEDGCSICDYCHGIFCPSCENPDDHDCEPKLYAVDEDGDPIFPEESER